MKNNTIKTIFIIITVAVVSTLLFIQLEHNKAKINEVTELANITGRYIPVKTEIVQLEAVNEKVVSNGFLKPFTDLYVISETQGRIVHIYKEKGDFVKAGDVIAEVDSELLTAQLNAIKAAIAQLEKDEKRFLTLQAQHAVTRRELETIQLNLKTNTSKLIAAERQLADTRIKAPVSGLINDDYIELGQFVGGGSRICNIVNNNKLKLTIKIPETDLKYIKSGQTANITSSMFPESEFQGKVISIGAKAGMGKSFDVEIILNNSGKNQFKAGQYVNVTLSRKDKTEKIHVSRNSINGSLKDASIYIIQNKKAIAKNITTGHVTGKMVEVISGVSEGDEIVTAGNYNLYNGATVKIIN
jgi:membrane fusion protein (multidrug efflux system)